MNIPEWAEWQCQDRWGRVWVYSHKPDLADYQGRVIWSPQEEENSRMMMLRFGSIPENWQDSLERIPAYSRPE